MRTLLELNSLMPNPSSQSERKSVLCCLSLRRPPWRRWRELSTRRFATTILSATQLGKLEQCCNLCKQCRNNDVSVFRQFQFTYGTRPRPRSCRIKSFNCELCRSVYFLDPFTVKTDQAFLRRIKLKLYFVVELIFWFNIALFSWKL